MRIKDRLPELVTFNIVCLIVLGITAAHNLYFSFHWPLFHDAPIQHYIAWRILEGAAPYRDVFDMNMPGVYILHLICLKLFGKSDFAFWLFDLIACFTSAGLLLCFAWQRSRIYAAIAALIFIAYHLSVGPVSLAQRDFLIVPFLLFAAYQLNIFLTQPETSRGLFWYGLAAGYALWIKPICILFIVLSGMTILLWRTAWTYKWRACFSMAAGITLATAAVHLWLYQHHGWADFYDILTGFILPIYTHLYQNYFSAEFFISGFWTLILGYGLLYHCSSPRADKAIAIIGLTYGFLHYVLQGKGWPYHLYPWWAFLALAGAVMFSGARVKNPDTLFFLHAMVICLSALLWFEPAKSYTPEKAGFTASYQEEVTAHVNQALQKVPASIRETYLRAYPGQAVHFFDFTRAHLWNIAYRQGWVAPIRHIYPFPFYDQLEPLPYMKKLREELFSTLRKRPPLVIVLSAESWPYKNGTLYRIIDKDPIWKKWFSEHYDMVKETEFYRIYARIQ